MSVTRSRFPGLSDDDRIVWSKVASTVRPRPGRTVERIAPPEPVSEAPGELRPLRPAPKNGSEDRKKPPLPLPQHGIDRVTKRKIAKGRLSIDARIDLHGMAQTEAHGLLFAFLHRAQADGCRLVLVITGKGSSFGSDGVLRRAVPAWLQTPPFRATVSGFEQAARGHGGEGALYLRIRQKGERR